MSIPIRAPRSPAAGDLPIGQGDGVAFLATSDDKKKPLDGRCDVVVSGVTPAARFWTLTLYDPKGRLVANSLQRYGFTSQEIIRGSDGAFEVRIAARSRAGNWLPTGGIERYGLVLRLYDTPVGVATRTPARCADALHRHGGVPMIRLLFTIIAGVLLGGVVHLVSVLALPRIATPGRLFAPDADHEAQRGYPAAAGRSRQHADAVHGSGVRDRDLPLRSVAAARSSSRCPSARPIRRCRSTPAATSPITPSTTAPRARKVIELDLMTEAQHADLPEDEDVTAADRLIINSPTATGLIVLKALAAEPGLMPQAQASLAAASCKVQTDPPAAPAKALGPAAKR